jgi:hypothetical protein
VPWKASDVSRHKKGLNAAQRTKWAAIANHVLASTGNEAEAIRTANSRVGSGQTRANRTSRKR